MKGAWLFFLCWVLFLPAARSQESDSSYQQLLAGTPELPARDSLLLNTLVYETNPLDSASLFRWFNRLAPSGTNRLTNRRYSLAGKVTHHPQFDLLMVVEEKNRKDSSYFQVLHLVTFHKSGKPIAHLEAAINGFRKNTGYQTRAWLCKDFELVQQSRLLIHEKEVDEEKHYTISGTGRFFLRPNH